MKEIIDRFMRKVVALPSKVSDFREELEILSDDIASVNRSLTEADSIFLKASKSKKMHNRRLDHKAANLIRHEVVFPLDVYLATMRRQRLYDSASEVEGEIPRIHPYRDEDTKLVLSECKDDLKELEKLMKKAKADAYKVLEHPAHDSLKHRKFVIDAQKQLRDALGVLRRMLAQIEFAGQEFEKHKKSIGAEG